MIESIQIDIEKFKNEVKNMKLCLTMDSTDTINNTLSPVSCRIYFDSINVSIIHPSYIELNDSKNTIRLSQINKIYKENYYGIDRYIINCGKLAQINKNYILEVL